MKPLLRTYIRLVPLNFSYSEACVITGLAPSAVHKAIERGTISRAAARSIRLDTISLLCLMVEAQGARHFPPRIRREVFQKIRLNPNVDRIHVGEAVTIDIASARRDLNHRLSELQDVKAMVERNRNILGGMPVFRGTRVPVRPILDMLDAEISAARISAAYPSLTEKAIMKAARYAKALVPRGRPPHFPWKIKPPAKRSRTYRKAEDLAASAL